MGHGAPSVKIRNQQTAFSAGPIYKMIDINQR